MAAKPKAVVIIGIVAVAIAAVASYALYNYLKGQEEKVATAVATTKVVVASQDISTGTTINTSQVKTADWPKANVPQGAFVSTDQVAGRIAVDRFVPGDIIVEAKLVPKEGQTGVLTYKIPEGHRAMTVAVDQVAGVAGFITPGNKVDVVLTTSPPGASQQISKIVLQNVPILATGQIVSEQQKDGKPVIVPTVTVDVTPEDAEKLAIASTQGRLQLVLRRAGDAEVAKTVGETVGKVMTGATVVAKAEKAQAPSTKTKVAKKTREAKAEKPAEVTHVEILRGSQKTTESFKSEK